MTLPKVSDSVYPPKYLTKEEEDTVGTFRKKDANL